MLSGLAPDLAPRLMIAIGGVAVAFLVLIAVLLFLRRRNSPLFIKGGRVREHRLQVLDAAAVDAKRRLVLIKRDDTEHLIMIGGPTDIVIETGISGENRQKPKTAISVVEKPIAPQPVNVQKPVMAEKPVPAVSPARPAEGLAAAQTNPRRPENERPQRQGHNGDGQNQRRMERQAARAAEAAKAGATGAASVSAASSLLYTDDSATPAEVVKPAQTSESASASTGQTGLKQNTVAAQAENVLDLARARVLTAPSTQQVANTHENAIRTLEEQLEAGKAEAQRAEAARQEALRLEAERLAAVKADSERAEAVRAEAARLEAVRLEAQKAEAARLEASRVERARLEHERTEAARAETARVEAQKAESERAEAARAEAERIATARADAMARFEAARRAQAEQRQAAQQPGVQKTLEEPAAGQQVRWPVPEPQMSEQIVRPQPQWPSIESAFADPESEDRNEKRAETDDTGSKSQERLASDFEKLLEAELEADGVLDRYPAVAAERREPGAGVPTINPVQRDTQPITGAMPGTSIEQDMARRLGEISLNRKTDAL